MLTNLLFLNLFLQILILPNNKSHYIKDTSIMYKMGLNTFFNVGSAPAQTRDRLGPGPSIIPISQDGLNIFIYRLTIISLIQILCFNFYDITLGNTDILFLNDNIRINQTILIQEELIIFITLILQLNYIPNGSRYFKAEFYLILLMNQLSINFLLESYNWIIFFIAWELFNLSLYIIIINNGINKQETLSASLKYFLLSAFSTIFLLLGLAILYHQIGNLEFESIISLLHRDQAFELKHGLWDTSLMDGWMLGGSLIFFALLFKMGAAPLHYWAPDLYDATILPIAAYISNIPKILYLFLIMNQIGLFGTPWAITNYDYLLIIIGLLSLIFGSIGLTLQYKIRRFLAFSAITNLGYFLLIISLQLDKLLFQNQIFYLLPVINIFIILIRLDHIHEKEINSFEELKGLFQINPFLSLIQVISLFSIAGIPPLPGFYAKYLLLSEIFIKLPPILFSIIIITTVIAVANYIRIIYIILFKAKPLILRPIQMKGILQKTSTIESNESNLIPLNQILCINQFIQTLLTYMDYLSPLIMTSIN